MTLWYSSAVTRYSSLPRPADAPIGQALGPNAVRVLMLGGNGPSVGWGVRSHGLALPGQFARELAGLTGRGVDVDLLSDPSFTVAGMPEALGGRDLSGCDVILVIPGAREVITLMQPSAWRRSVEGLLGVLRAAVSSRTRLVFAGCQPIRSIPAFDSPLAAVAAPHRLLLNALAEEICRGRYGTSYVTLPASTALHAGRYRSPDDYQFWARTLADHVALSAFHSDSIAGRPDEA